MVPESVLGAYGWQEFSARAATSGLINETYFVVADDDPRAVLQRLHPVFAAEVNVDLDAVTKHLASRGLETPG